MSSISGWLIALAAASAPASRGEVLDFSARWCGPCQQMAPLVARLEREGLPIRTVDVDANRELAARFNISRLPTFVLVVDDREVARHTGFLSEQDLRGWLAQIPQASPPPGPETAANPPPATVPYVADPQVRLGSPQPIARALDDLPRPADPVSETRPAPQRESLAATGGEPRRGLWPFRGGGGKTAPREKLAAEIRASDAPLVEPARTPPPPDAAMASSVRLRVTIDGRINLGSGTVVESGEGRSLIVTCGHIFRGFTDQSRIEVNLFENGQEQSLLGRLVKFDLEADVGLVEVEGGRDLPTAPVARDVQRAHEQEKVVSIGCSGGQPPSREDLVVTAVNPYLGPDNLECTGIPVQGRSGGGLFRPTGELVGVCIAADPARKRGVYAGLKAIHDLLDQTGKSYLYRTPEPAAVAAAPAASPLPSSGEASSRPDEAAPVRSLFDDVLPAGNIPPRDVPAIGEWRNAPPTAAASPTSAPRSSTPVALGPEAEDAEIVCIIRPRRQPDSASQVVIIHQASPKMLAYLRGELGAAGGGGASLLSTQEHPWGTGAPPVAIPAPEQPPRQPLDRASATLSHRQPGLEATVLTTSFQPRRFVRSR